MNKDHQAAIERQLLWALTDSENPQETFKQVLQETLPPADYKAAIQTFDKTGSISETLIQCHLFQLDDDLLSAVKHVESTKPQLPIFSILSPYHEHLAQTYRHLKTRLLTGLMYALLLSAKALVIFGIVQMSVLPGFAEVFNAYGASLPSLTQFALIWHQSILSPVILIALVTLALVVLILTLKNTTQVKSLKLLSRMPFLKMIISHLKAVSHLHEMQLYYEAGDDIEDILARYQKILSENKNCEDIGQTLTLAKKLGTFEKALKFSQAELMEKSKTIADNAARLLVTCFLTIIIAYIVFMIFATYLPIFKLGAAI